MNGDELYHYGVPGMRWGVRRAKNQLSKLTGRDKTKISDDEAQRFRKDVKVLKKMNKADRSEYGNATLTSKRGKEYADAVIKQAGKEKVKSIIGKTAAIAAGTAAVGIALKKLNKKMAEMNFKKGSDSAHNRMFDLIEKSFKDRGKAELSKKDLVKSVTYYSKFKN